MELELNKIYNIDCQKGLEGICKQSFADKIIFVSDPPFNINYKYKSYDDNKNEDDYYEWLEKIFFPFPCVIIHYPEALYKFAFQIGKFPERVISWVYNSNTKRQHRDIGFFGVVPNFEQVKQPYKNLADKRIIERIENGETGANLYDWWEINQVKNVSEEKCDHPCQMPLEVMRNIIGILPYDAVIIDPFAGTGTTCLAVSIMNKVQGAKRNYIGFEIDKDYYNSAVERLEAEKAQMTFFD